MMASFAPLLFVGWIAWLLYRDAKERPSVPGATWIVVAWVVIYGSRPVTSWFAGADALAAGPESPDEGNLGEALISLSLIMAGMFVLMQRGVNLLSVLRENRWVFVFYGFWTISVLWSDFPVLTAKRLFRDVGNIVMVLVILTARDPVEAIKATLARCAYLTIPLSIMFIRYVPHLGRAYVGYDRSEVMHVGVATHKNTLGALALVTALFLLWDLLDRWRRWHGPTERLTYLARAVVLLMCWYLLVTVDSVTSLVCAGLGSALLVAFALPSVRGHPGRLEAYAVSGVLAAWMVDAVFNIKEAFIQRLGRDMTLTTRMDIWPIILDAQENPLVGAGFNTFWSGPRLTELGEKLGGVIVQAHNGYLETYLNGGFVGLGLLGVLLAASYWRIRKELALGGREGAIRFALLLLVVVHNWSEASFNKLSVLWFVTVFALMRYSVLKASLKEKPWWAPVSRGRSVTFSVSSPSLLEPR